MRNLIQYTSIYPRRITAAGIANALAVLERSIDGNKLVVLYIDQHDPVEWASFGPPTCTIPGIDVGQVFDYRYALAGGMGMHVQGFADGHVEIHFDHTDACHAPVQHVAEDTKAVEYGLFGGLLMAGLGAIAGGSRAAATGFALGVGGGGLLGAHTPKRRRVVIRLATLLSA